MQLVTKKKATTELFEKIIMFFYICERMPSSLNKTMLWHESSPIYERYMDKRESLFYSNMKPEIKKREWDFFLLLHLSHETIMVELRKHLHHVRLALFTRFSHLKNSNSQQCLRVINHKSIEPTNTKKEMRNWQWTNFKLGRCPFQQSHNINLLGGAGAVSFTFWDTEELNSLIYVHFWDPFKWCSWVGGGAFTLYLCLFLCISNFLINIM